VTLCGEMASRTIGAMTLIALGYRSPLACGVGGRPGEGDGAQSLMPARAAAVVKRADRADRRRRPRSGEVLTAFAEAAGVPL